MTVYLVGAGPGDPELLTVKAARLLQEAEIVIHDRLIDSEMLTLINPEAELIDVGKRPGEPRQQEVINALLAEHGLTKETVVRLKGGDPFVFGRGGEELAALHQAGIAAVVVPGVTSAVAAPAYAGIPLTHRPVSTSFTVVTGHRKHGESEVNWDALAKTGGTIVVLMGVTQRADIARQLINGGLAPTTPVAAIRWGTYVTQTTTRTNLAELGQTDLQPPSVIVIGAVAALNLPWFPEL